MKTVVGVFDSNSDAQRVRDSLVAAGIAADEISIHSTESGGLTSAEHIERTSSAKGEGGGVSGFFRRLFGMDDASGDELSGMYSEAVRRGSCVVTANVDDEQAGRAESIMDECGAIDIDQRAAAWRQAGWSGPSASAASPSASDIENERYAGPKQTISVVEEQLQVGKREVERGRVRVFTHISERPVEESVRLREEHATVQRRPVDRPATEADLAAMKEGSMEVRETAEEAVVAKTARVVEEVEVGKEGSERTETVRDTVRKTEVEVDENVEASDETGKTRRRGSPGTQPRM